jgi:hypothetical protein
MLSLHLGQKTGCSSLSFSLGQDGEESMWGSTK